MHQRHQATLAKLSTKPASANASAYLILQLAIPLDRIGPAQRGELLGYQDHKVTVLFEAAPLPDPDNLPLDQELARQATLDGAVPEHARPLEGERCAQCGLEIGDDPTAAFHVPVAGRPLPVHGACLEEIAGAEDEDEEAAEEGEPDAVEASDVAGDPFDAKPVRACRVCGCTDDDCSECIAKTGRPCEWVEEDLCSACVGAEPGTEDERQPNEPARVLRI